MHCNIEMSGIAILYALFHQFTSFAISLYIYISPIDKLDRLLSIYTRVSIIDF